MSNNDVKNNDAGNRGMIEVKGKKSPKKLLILIALAVLALFIAVLVAKILPGKEVKQTGMEPKNEALVNNSVESDQITGFMKNIKDKEERDRKEREAREAREKEAKAKAEREQAGGNENAGAVNAVTAGSGSTRSVEQGGDDKDKPLPKPLRQLTGDTMVAMDNGKQQDSAPEKDALQGGSYADGSVSPVMKRRYLLSAGTSLSCVLKTKIVTSYPGVTLCQLTKDVYSDNGETLLARKGAMLQGEQNKVMTQGVARVFVIWTNLKDGNINARIDALGTDRLASMG